MTCSKHSANLICSELLRDCNLVCYSGHQINQLNLPKLGIHNYIFSAFTCILMKTWTYTGLWWHRPVVYLSIKR